MVLRKMEDETVKLFEKIEVIYCCKGGRRCAFTHMQFMKFNKEEIKTCGECYFKDWNKLGAAGFAEKKGGDE